MWNFNNNGNIHPTEDDGLLKDIKDKAREERLQQDREKVEFCGYKKKSNMDSKEKSTIEKLRTKRFEYENAIKALDLTGDSGAKSVEGQFIERGSWAGNVIGVFTSGGDSQGMNASVRAVVRMGLFLGCRVYYINEGYQGMVDGEENLVEATWASTSNTIHVGGTKIGSARCMDFKERWGRLQAAQNLIDRGIVNLIAIGGDGSLTGANLFRKEWASLLKELVDTERVSRDKLQTCAHLNIVGLVGSIDNDFCGTDLTIGVDSALTRIQAAIDDITTTAVSHKRAFVLEIMGRMCGYLPLVAGIACEASAILIPEDPPLGDWKQTICDMFLEKLQSGEKRRTHIILIAEGAMDRKCNEIKAEDVKKVLSERLGMDTRTTVLGHVQRGGNTSAMDRLLGSRQGAEAVLALKDAKNDTPACVIGMVGYDIVRIPLMKAVERTKAVGPQMTAGNFEDVIILRGRPIFTNLYVYLLTQKVIPHPNLVSKGRKTVLRIGIVMVGSPACGMNACARGFVSLCITNGYRPMFIHDGWHGLCHDKVVEATWNDVQFWTANGGSNIGIRPTTAKEQGIYKIASKLAEHKISALAIVGGFNAFQSACELLGARNDCPELCIPITVVPATISNNVPSCAFSLGADTALNQICNVCDDLKKSAFSVQKCVYVVEVGGDTCGYLTTMAGIAVGADEAFISEEKFTIEDIQALCNKLKEKLRTTDIQQGLILINENASTNLTTDFVYRLMSEEAKDAFITRKVVLGYTQEGNTASVHDRSAGVTAGCRVANWLIRKMEENGAKLGSVFTDDPSTICVCSTKGGRLDGWTKVEELIASTDFRRRLPKHQWWLRLRPLLRILASVDAVIGDVQSETSLDSIVENMHRVKFND